MSLYRRQGQGPYWIRISVAGRKIRKSTGTTDKKAAQEFEQRERERAWRHLRLGDRSQTLWREAAARWLLETRKRTKDKDESMLAWIGGHLDNVALGAIDREQLEILRRQLRKQGCSDTTIDRYLAVIRAILRKSRDEWDYLTHIPKVPMYGARPFEPRWLSRAEFEKLKRELPPHLKLAAEFAVLTGLRMRAMLSLTWNRIDLERRRAWIPLVHMKGKRTFGFPLSTAAMKVLAECHEMYPTGKHVFQYKGEPYDDCNGAAFQKAVARAGLAPLRWHDLRHTFASWAVQNGVSLQELMQLGDWRSYSMVLRYAHLAPDHLLGAAEKVAFSSQEGHTGVQKGHTESNFPCGENDQVVDSTGGEGGTRTLDLGIMSATL